MYRGVKSFLLSFFYFVLFFLSEFLSEFFLVFCVLTDNYSGTMTSNSEQCAAQPSSAPAPAFSVDYNKLFFLRIERECSLWLNNHPYALRENDPLARVIYWLQNMVNEKKWAALKVEVTHVEEVESFLEKNALTIIDHDRELLFVLDGYRSAWQFAVKGRTICHSLSEVVLDFDEFATLKMPFKSSSNTASTSAKDDDDETVEVVRGRAIATPVVIDGDQDDDADEQIIAKAAVPAKRARMDESQKRQEEEELADYEEASDEDDASDDSQATQPLNYDEQHEDEQHDGDEDEQHDADGNDSDNEPGTIRAADVATKPADATPSRPEGMIAIPHGQLQRVRPRTIVWRPPNNGFYFCTDCHRKHVAIE